MLLLDVSVVVDLNGPVSIRNHSQKKKKMKSHNIQWITDQTTRRCDQHLILKNYKHNKSKNLGTNKYINDTQRITQVEVQLILGNWTDYSLERKKEEAEKWENEPELILPVVVGVVVAVEGDLDEEDQQSPIPTNNI